MPAVSVRGLVLALALSLPAAPALAQDDFQSRILAAHNSVRAQVRTPPLRWSSQLAADAQAWANVLARKGRLQHAGQHETGENLWMGTTGAFSIEEMVGAWAAERSDYRHGEWPYVAGKGKMVGHYTQMVWRTTTRVGCAMARGERKEVLVCRYSPPGNWVGHSAY